MKIKKHFKKGAIKHLQKYIEHKIERRGFNDESVHERLVLLMEEVGELAKACRTITGMHCNEGRAINADTGEEVVDVINMVFAVAIALGLDVEKEFIKKDKIIDTRSYTRSKKFYEKTNRGSK